MAEQAPGGMNRTAGSMGELADRQDRTSLPSSPADVVLSGNQFNTQDPHQAAPVLAGGGNSGGANTLPQRY